MQGGLTLAPKIPLDSIDKKDVARAIKFIAANPEHEIIKTIVSLIFRLEGDLSLNDSNYELVNDVSRSLRDL